jgi:hypothetical protein
MAFISIITLSKKIMINVPEINSSSEKIEKALIDIAVESWRFSRVFAGLLTKLDTGESPRYINQLRYYQKRLAESLEVAELNLVSIEGETYDPGQAVSALNLGDFGPDDVLIIDQMVEPIIMGHHGLVKPGTVMLRKVEQ